MTRASERERVSLVFAGGGCRTFWSLGVFDRIESLLPEVREWAGVSAGAAMAATSCVGLGAKTIETFKALAEANEKNAYFSNLFRRQPVFPHEGIYRAAIQEVFKGEGFDALKAGAPVRILLAYVNAGAPRVRSVFGAMRAYRTRKNNHIVHGPEKPLPGLGAFTLTAQHCCSLDELGDVILASSATPPMTSAPSVNGCTHIDGGFVENAPVRALSDEARAGKVIVLLTRPIPEDKLPISETRLYLTPSRTVPITIWDYTSPEKIMETFRQGQRDAAGKIDLIQAFLD